MEQKPTRIWTTLGNLFLAAVAGSIISLPLLLAVIANRLDRIETIYFAVEACKAGSDMEACGVLRGEDK